MDYRPLNIVLESATGLKKPTFIRKMDVYAVAHISGATTNLQKLKTPIAKNARSNPTWNSPMKFIVNEAAVSQNQLSLVIKIKAAWLLGGRSLGKVRIPVKELVDGVKPETNGMQSVGYEVRRSSGKPKGVVNLMYEFGETFLVEEPPVSQQPVVQTRRSRTKGSGMGFKTGLLGGALGGMVIGDTMSGGGGGCGGGGCGGGGCGGGGCGGGGGGGGCGGGGCGGGGGGEPGLDYYVPFALEFYH